jgi:diaminopimelate decarboxylase
VVLVAAPWWTRPGLEARDGRLTIAGEDAEALARRHRTPLFVYDLARFAENARRLAAALEATGLETRLRFALKANPEPRILATLRPYVGIDACSPGEVARAIECGWTPAEISYTGTNLSERDLDAILPLDVHLNLDAVSQIARVGRRAPGRSIGLRVNPGAGAGYHPGLAYSGDRPTKFGIYEDRLDEAVTVARDHDLTIDTIHFHAGSGWLGREGLAGFEEALARVAAIVERLQADGHPIDEVNVGGGLGVQARADEDTALLLGEVVTVEDRGGSRFVGLDIGWNVNCSYFIYRFLQEIVVCRAADAPRTELVTVAGHINEAGDVFAEDYAMPPVREGDIVALLNAGGYHQAMSSTHCLRPVAEALYLER